MMNEDVELQRFAELLMRLVRDQAIDTCDALAARRMGGPIGRRWRAVLADKQAQAAVRELIPDIVDQTLFYLVNALDQGDLPLALQRADGSFAELYDLGGSEMAGWLMAPDGWRAEYSSQRFADPDAAS